MTTANTAPAGIDLDSLTRYDHRGALMVPDETGDYFNVADVRDLARRAAQDAPAADERKPLEMEWRPRYEMLARASIAHPIGQISTAIDQAPYSAPFTTDVRQCCESPETCAEPCQPPAPVSTPAQAVDARAWREATEAAANVVIKSTRVPRDLLGPASAAMKAAAQKGETIAAAIRALPAPIPERATSPAAAPEAAHADDFDAWWAARVPQTDDSLHAKVFAAEVWNASRAAVAPSDAKGKADDASAGILNLLERMYKHHCTTSLPLAVENYGSREAAGDEGRKLWREEVPAAIAAMKAGRATIDTPEFGKLMTNYLCAVNRPEGDVTVAHVALVAHIDAKLTQYPATSAADALRNQDLEVVDAFNLGFAAGIEKGKREATTSAADAQDAPQWRPIAEAPRDGTRFWYLRPVTVVSTTELPRTKYEVIEVWRKYTRPDGPGYWMNFACSMADHEVAVGWFLLADPNRAAMAASRQGGEHE